MSSTTTLVLVAAVVAVVLVGIVAATRIRSRRTVERRLDEGLLELGERMDTLAGELARTIDRMRDDALRARLVESLGRALDIEEVLARCVEAAAALRGVVGARVRIELEGSPLSAASGLAVGGDHDAGVVGGPPDGGRVRAVGISYHYPVESAAAPAIRSAIAIPLEQVQDGGHLGFLTVFGHSEEPPVTGSDLQALQTIAGHTAVAIESARRRLGGAGREPGVDVLTGLGNRLALHETLGREVARAHRQGRRLAVCTFDIDGLERANTRPGGQLQGDTTLVAVAEVLREALRPSDLACRSGGAAFAVILPDAGRIEGEALCARVQARLRRGPVPVANTVSLSAGIAELKPDDDGVSLFDRCERARERAKQTGKGAAA